MGRTCVRSSLAIVILIFCIKPALVGAQATSPPEGWVVLPVDEYRILRERTLPPRPSPASAVDATLTRVDYELRFDGESVSGSAALTIDVLRDGWVKVPIPAGLMARDARVDGQPVSLVAGPPPYILLPRSGRAVVMLEIVLPLQPVSAGADAVLIPGSNAPISHVSLTVPRAGIDLSVAGGFTIDRTETSGESRWNIVGTLGRQMQVSWKRKLDDRRAEQPLRLRARVTELVGLGEETGSVTASIHIDVQQGIARELTIAVPADLAVNQVNGSTVADWNVRPDGLHVSLLEPTTTDVSFVVTAEGRMPRDGSMVIPLVRVPMAERESGGLAVDVVGAGEIASRQSRNLEPGDPSEVGDIVAGRESPSMIAFRLRPVAGTDERTLSVSVVRYTPQAVLVANVEEARYRALASEDGRVLIEARYAVRNNQRSFLKVTLPPGGTLWSASVANRPVRPGVAEQGAVLLPLLKGRAGEEAPTFVVSLVYLQTASDWATSARITLVLPALDLPVSRTGLELHHSPRFTVRPQPGTFRAEADPGPTAEALRALMGSSSTLRVDPGFAAHSSANADAANAAAMLDTNSPSVARPQPSLQALVDSYQRNDASRTIVGTLPVSVTFPTVGPSLFLASELTAEGRPATVELDIKKVN
jgi:hypothetical protein